MATLREIIDGALSESDAALKMASASAAAPAEETDFLADELPAAKTKTAHDEAHETPAEERAEEAAKKKAKEHEKKASRDQVVGDADYAMKLAKALRVSSGILRAKIAKGDALSAPGPQVMAGADHGTTKSPKPQPGGVTDKIEGGHLPGPASLPTTRHDFTSVKDESGAPKNHPGKTASKVDWTKSKTASLRMLRAKMAEAETLMAAGQTELADKLLAEIKEGQAKLAQDPSSPPPVMPGHSEAFKLDTEPGPSTHIPDNAGLISITKAQAKDPTTREVTQHFTGTPKKDNAVAAHTLRTDGQKLSAADPIVKTAAPTKDPAVKPAYDSGMKRTHDDPTKSSAPAVKSAELDPKIARALLTRIIKTANDPEADPKDREKAASTLAALKTKLDAVQQDALSA